MFVLHCPGSPQDVIIHPEILICDWQAAQTAAAGPLVSHMLLSSPPATKLQAVAEAAGAVQR